MKRIILTAIFFISPFCFANGASLPEDAKLAKGTDDKGYSCAISKVGPKSFALYLTKATNQNIINYYRNLDDSRVEVSEDAQTPRHFKILFKNLTRLAPPTSASDFVEFQSIRFKGKVFHERWQKNVTAFSNISIRTIENGDKSIGAFLSMSRNLSQGIYSNGNFCEIE